MMYDVRCPTGNFKFQNFAPINNHQEMLHMRGSDQWFNANVNAHAYTSYTFF